MKTTGELWPEARSGGRTRRASTPRGQGVRPGRCRERRGVVTAAGSSPRRDRRARSTVHRPRIASPCRRSELDLSGSEPTRRAGEHRRLDRACGRNRRHRSRLDAPLSLGTAHRRSRSRARVGAPARVRIHVTEGPRAADHSAARSPTDSTRKQTTPPGGIARHVAPHGDGYGRQRRDVHSLAQHVHAGVRARTTRRFSPPRPPDTDAMPTTGKRPCRDAGWRRILTRVLF